MGRRCGASARSRSRTRGWRSSTWPAATSRSTPRTASVTAIVNGEIYNHLELRARLEREGHRFATRSDSEVVVHGYEQSGPDFVRDLNGIFAFALWDAPKRRLVAARDQFGVKPLYWWSDGRRVALASEVGALIAAGLVQPEVDRVALDHFLACRFVPAPRTLFEGVQKLPPASMLTVEEGGTPRVTSFREAPGSPARGRRRRARRRGWPRSSPRRWSAR